MGVEVSAVSAPGRDQVVAALVVCDGRALLCHRSPERRWYPDVWDLAGGHVEAGESPARALVRELREELGVSIAEPSGPELARFVTEEHESLSARGTRFATPLPTPRFVEPNATLDHAGDAATP